MALLYIGTFGSFIGFGFAFGQVLLVQFPDQFPVPVRAAALTFLGPLLGSLIRPFGGGLADRFKGSVVTFYNFIAMAVGAVIVLIASQLNSLPVFLIGFVMLFVFSGIGNGSTYKMIPSIFEAKAQGHDEWSREEKAAWSRSMSGALIGFAGAVGALGGVFINIVLRMSYVSDAKSATNAFWVFLGFYVICAIVTWFVFLRLSSSKAAASPAALPESVVTA